MEVKRIVAAYWSATGNTDKTVNTIADALAAALAVPLERRSFTRPAERETDLVFAPGDLVVFGMPTYAGKLPNKMLPFVREQVHGNGALAVGVVLSILWFHPGKGELPPAQEDKDGEE